MSRSYIVEVYKTKAVEVLELQNSHGSKPMAWTYLLEKLFPNKEMHWFQQKDLGLLYSKGNEPTLPTHYKAALFFSGWRTCVLVKHLAEFTKDIRQFSNEVTPYLEKKSYVNHWAAIATFLENYKPNKRLVGLALHGTSVDDEWEINPSKEDVLYSTDLSTPTEKAE